MPTRLAEYLRAARQQQFVGRDREQKLFRTALKATPPPYFLLYIYGPGGIGKSSLLRAFTSLAEAEQAAVYWIDGRDLDPTPDGFLAALRNVVGLPPGSNPVSALSQTSTRSCLFIDTYETLTPLDNWLREGFLPELPENVLVVMAGRNALSPSWRVDPGWQPLLRTIPLRNLEPEESRSYLKLRRLPENDHDAILNFTYGHPLALSLVADAYDQRTDWHFCPEQAPDFIKVLLEQFVQKVPSPAHRATLEACALVRHMKETLLARMLDMNEVHGLFEWLRGLSFIESGPNGLYPHDLAREALVTDLRWRNPDWHTELHQRARTYYAARLEQTTGREQQHVLMDYVYLHRDNPIMRPFIEWQEMGHALTDAPHPEDWPVLEAMVARHEGTESARLAAFWFERCPEGVLVFRESGPRPIGFLNMLTWSPESPLPPGPDPALATAQRYLAGHAPLRPGEHATLFRFWMGDEDYQSVSSTQSVVFLNIAQYYLTTPGLAFTFFPCSDPDFWEPFCRYIDLCRLPETDFVVGGHRYGVYVHDWRIHPPATWLAILAEREVSTEPEQVHPPETEPFVFLSESAFADAVWDALRMYRQPARLRQNPLLRARLLVEEAGLDADEPTRIETLRRLIESAASLMTDSSRDEKLYRVLVRTYLNPADSQEQAAELLNLPFSTYRRYLKKAIHRVAEHLWHREITGVTRF